MPFSFMYFYFFSFHTSFIYMKNSLISILILFSITCYSQELNKFKVTRYDTITLNGYYFLTSNNSLTVLDKDENTIYYKPGKALFDFTLETNGTIVFTDVNKSYIMDSAFRVVDSFACGNGVKYDPHDKLILPNGNILLLGSEIVNMDISHYPHMKNSKNNDTANFTFPVIQEQNMQHKIIFEWHGAGQFDLIDGDAFINNNDIHGNALALDGDGNILLSSKNNSEITKISRKDGTVMWRFGGMHNEFKFINCPVPFSEQHNIRRLSNGHYTLFDNGSGKKPHCARAMEFELDDKNKTATLVWSYETDVNSFGRGSVQRLPDGNTLINFGKQSGGNVAFILVSPAGAKILQVNGYRADRVMYCARLPFQLHRPEINCIDSAGANYLDAGAGYKSYKWSTGETTSKIKLTHPDTYSVFVPYGDNGYINSEDYIVTDVSQPCNIKPSPNLNKLPDKGKEGK